MKRLRVAIVGAGGKLGAFACRTLENDPGFEIAARLRSADDVPRALRDARADVVFESTVAGLGARHARLALQAGSRPLIATSGVTEAEARDLDGLARELHLGGLYAPNLSRGMWLLQTAAEAIARHVGTFEIVEMHHEAKRDAPSGTAADTARLLASVRREVDPRSTARAPIHSVRLPGLIAHQEVIFGAPGELVTLRHDAFGQEAYGPGILAGLAYVARASGFATGIGRAFQPAEPL